MWGRLQKAWLLLMEQRLLINHSKCVRGQFSVVDLSVLSNMDLRMLEERYLSFPAVYARRIGVWPIQPASHQRYLCTFVYSIAAIACFTQVARIVKYYSLDILLEQIPFLAVPVIACIKHYGYTYNNAKFKELFVSMLCDWQKEMTKDEEQIMDRYANRGLLYAGIYTANAYFVGLVFFFVPFLPYILDFILPLNETRRRVQMYEAYYFVQNQDDYYYYIFAWTILTLMIAVSMFIGTDTILICTVQHCCGLLALSGYRLKSSLGKWSSSSSHAKMDYNNMYKAVSSGISTHRRALEFLIEIENAYKLSLFLVVGASSLTFTATLVKAATETLSADTYQFYGYVVAQIVHLFFLTIQGQFVINVHESVYRKGYDATWHKADCKTQALFILILRQSLTPPLLTAGGLVQLNLNTFTETIKASVSYFTVLKSV